jgi:hypothetical protein
MPDRRFPPPWLQPPANRSSSRRIGLDGLVGAARRYADHEAVRVLGAFVIVIAVGILAVLAWLWVFS